MAFLNPPSVRLFQKKRPFMYDWSASGSCVKRFFRVFFCSPVRAMRRFSEICSAISSCTSKMSASLRL